MKRKLRRTSTSALELALGSPPAAKAKKPTFFPYVVTDSPLSKKRSMARRMRNTSAPPTSIPDEIHAPHVPPPSTEQPPTTSVAESTTTIKVEEDDEAILWDGSCFDLTIEEEEHIKAIEASNLLKSMIVDADVCSILPEAPPVASEDRDIDLPDAPPGPPTFYPITGIDQGAPFLMMDNYGNMPIVCPQPQHPPNFSLPDLPALVPITDSSPPSSPSPSTKAKGKGKARAAPVASWNRTSDHNMDPVTTLHPLLATPGSSIQFNIPNRPLYNLCSSPPPPPPSPPVRRRIPVAPPSLESTSSSIPISDFLRRRALLENDVDESNISDDEDDEDSLSRVITRLPHQPRTVKLYKEKGSIPGPNWTKPTKDDPWGNLLNLNFTQLEVWPSDAKHAVIVSSAGQGCPRPTEEEQAVAKLRKDLTTAVGPINGLDIVPPAQEMFLYGDNNPPHCFLLRGFGKATKEFLLDLQCISTQDATLFFSPNNPPVDTFIMTLAGFRTPKAKRILRIINAGIDGKSINAQIIRLSLNQPQFAGMNSNSIVSEVRDSLRIQIVYVTDGNGVQTQYVHVFMNMPTSDPYHFRTIRGIMTSAKFTDPYITMNIRVVHDWCCSLCNSMLHLTEACFLITEPGWIVNPSIIADAKNSNSNAPPPPPPPPPPAAIAMTGRGGSSKGRGRGSGNGRGHGGQGGRGQGGRGQGSRGNKGKGRA